MRVAVSPPKMPPGPAAPPAPPGPIRKRDPEWAEPPNRPAYISQIVEISELTDGQVASAKFIRDAAANWDGSDPIRNLG